MQKDLGGCNNRGVAGHLSCALPKIIRDLLRRGQPINFRGSGGFGTFYLKYRLRFKLLMVESGPNILYHLPKS